jgi:hypothetical protein
LFEDGGCKADVGNLAAIWVYKGKLVQKDDDSGVEYSVRLMVE